MLAEGVDHYIHEYSTEGYYGNEGYAGSGVGTILGLFIVAEEFACGKEVAFDEYLFELL